MDRIKRKINKVADISRKFITEKYNKLCEWYHEFENKRILWGAVSTWIFAFLVIIIICRITNASKLTVTAVETANIESESTYETSENDKSVVKEVSAKQTEVLTTTVIPTTAEVIEAKTEKIETETVDVTKLSVSTTPIADDKEKSVKRIASINSADIKTVSSTDYEENQFSYGIDISYHQGKIDWAKVKAAGIEYAFIRVGNRGYETGKLCKDARFDENVRGALANGIKVGVYFFSQAVTEQEALEEASLTLKYIKGYNIALPVVIDWETDKGYRTYSGLTQNELTKIISKFCDTIEKYGYDSMVYMCKDDYINRINSKSITSKYKTWVAWYFSEYASSEYIANRFKYGDLLPYMTFRYYMWQYSCMGKVDGINELVDMNIMILPKKTYDIKISNTKKKFVTNIGNEINLLEGVSAYDSSGNSAAGKVEISITDAGKNKVNKENVFTKSGEYNITYTYKDANGKSVSTEAKLYVRDIPEIYFEGKLWKDNSKIVLKYEYDNDLNAEDNYDKIVGYIKEKLSAYYYETISGTEKHSINNGTFTYLGDIMVNGDIESKTLDVVYTVSDGNGLSNNRTISLEIIRKDEEETDEDKYEDESVNEDILQKNG